MLRNVKTGFSSDNAGFGETVKIFVKKQAIYFLEVRCIGVK